MDFGLRGKTVLVTAASQGLGFATAKAFAHEGASVMLCSRREQALERAVELIRQETGNQSVAYQVADLTDRAAIDALFHRVENEFGGVDILINNAGGPKAGTFDDVTEDDWDAAYTLSLKSIVRSIERALPHMRAQHFGRIVNFASSSIKQPLENLVLSNTFRAAIAGLSKTLSFELGPDGILVNTIGPGKIATERVAALDEGRAKKQGTTALQVRASTEKQIPLMRYGNPDEFARTALFLGSPANSYVTGQSILVDGGLVRSL